MERGVTGVDYDLGMQDVSGIRLIKAESDGATLVCKVRGFWLKICDKFSLSSPPSDDEVRETIINHLSSTEDGGTREAVLSLAS
jgi:hypothetical protein